MGISLFVSPLFVLFLFSRLSGLRVQFFSPSFHFPAFKGMGMGFVYCLFFLVCFPLFVVLFVFPVLGNEFSFIVFSYCFFVCIFLSLFIFRFGFVFVIFICFVLFYFILSLFCCFVFVFYYY